MNPVNRFGHIERQAGKQTERQTGRQTGSKARQALMRLGGLCCLEAGLYL